jgi:excisionase family DNA binding protein
VPAKTGHENIRVISWRGPIYTVEEVSELLGIPRPTLYRYLREYSIPHYRRSGKISIPEDSLERIREARDLHKEGLGTESVRRLLREGGSATNGELGERLDALSETLKGLKEKAETEEPVSSPALRTLLARQSLLISAVFNLTEMVEEILLASGKPRKTVFGEVAGDLRAVTPLPEYARARRLGGPQEALTAAEATDATVVPAAASTATIAPVETSGNAGDGARVREGRFGHLSRRRRRGTLALLSVVAILLIGGLLAWQLPTLLGERAAQRTAVAGREQEREPEKESARGSGTADERRKPEAAVGSAASERDGANAAAEPATRAAGPVEAQKGEVPDVTGRGVEEAARELFEAGYEIAAIKTGVAGPEGASTVTGTDPPAGTAAQPGTPVVIVTGGEPGDQ